MTAPSQDLRGHLLRLRATVLLDHAPESPELALFDAWAVWVSTLLALPRTPQTTAPACPSYEEARELATVITLAVFRGGAGLPSATRHAAWQQGEAGFDLVLALLARRTQRRSGGDGGGDGRR